jgi:enterochelin esterase-like enzyme
MACRSGDSEPASPPPGAAGAPPTTTADAAVPPAPAAQALPTPTLPVQGPNLPTALEEYVGPLWGHFREERFYSAALDRVMPYYIYLPPGHDDAAGRVPVLYMLHGASGDNAEWATIGIINWADRLIASGEMPPLLLVLPQGDFGYWVNHVNGGPRWGDYVVEDLVLQLDENYRTLPLPRARAVGGLSQGGHAALQLTFNHPDIFGVAGAHGPSLRPDDGFLPWLGSGAEYARRDPISLAESLPLSTLQSATLWLDVGSEDEWRPRVELLHEILAERGVVHEYHVWPGAHDGEYWQPHVPDYLRYYGRALRPAVEGG